MHAVIGCKGCGAANSNHASFFSKTLLNHFAPHMVRGVLEKYSRTVKVNWKRRPILPSFSENAKVVGNRFFLFLYMMAGCEA